MMTDKVKFCDRSQGYCDPKSLQDGLEVYWAGVLERVRSESELVSSKGELLETLPSSSVRPSR